MLTASAAAAAEVAATATATCTESRLFPTLSLHSATLLIWHEALRFKPDCRGKHAGLKVMEQLYCV